MDTTRRASTVYRWAGMWYVRTLGVGDWQEGSNPWHLQPSCCSTVTWVSASPLFPPGCPGPQDQLREVIGQEGCSLQCSLVKLSLAPTVHESSAEPGRARWKRKVAATSHYVAHHSAARGTQREHTCHAEGLALKVPCGQGAKEGADLLHGLVGRTG